MDTIYSLLKRAKELKEKSQVDSITPEEVGKLHEDTLAYIASLEQSTDGLGIKKVYQSKLAMEADTDPVGTNGKALRYGQLVSIYDDAHTDGSENGNIYAYQKPGWLLMGKVSGNTGLSVVQEAGDSATKVMSQRAVTEAINANVQGKIEERNAIDSASIEWRKGGYLKADGSVYATDIFTCAQVSVEGYSRAEFQYQAYSYILATLICDSDGNIIQRFGVDVNGSPLTWKTAEIDLPTNAATIRMTGYDRVKPSLTLIKKVTVNEKTSNLDVQISALEESVKELFIRDYTNSIRYNTGGINVSDGSFASNGYDTFAVSDFIEIPEGAVKINLGYQGYSKVYGSVIYNNEKQKIVNYSVSANASKAGDVYETGYINIPSGAKYVRITSYQSDREKKVPLMFLMNSADVVGHKELKEYLEKNGVVSPLKSKRLAFCGDSITFGLNQDGGARLDAFPEQVGGLLGCQTTNYGVSSASVGGTSPRVWSKDYTVVSTEEDIIGVMIGINDFYRDYSLGNRDGSSGFYKDLHTMWKGFISRFPPSAGKRLFCMIYPYYDAKSNWEKWTAAMQEVAEYYSIPVLDLSKELGINPHMDTNFEYWREEGAHTGKHNAHPTQPTHDMMAKVIAAYVKSHYDV